MFVKIAGLDDISVCHSYDQYIPHEVLVERIEHGQILLCFHEEEALGYLRFSFLWGEFPFMELIYVNGNYRHRHVGHTMLEFLEEHLRSKGFKTLYSSSQADESDAQHWHRTAGFEECGFIASLNKDGVGEVFFKKSL